MDARALLARCTFPPPGSALACAVSGGADSLCLLALAAEAGCTVTAIHVDHGLRPDSAAEADVVRRAAARLGATFVAESVSVEPGPNLEARARAARYAVLPAGVATGHTADDQAETLLLHLLRGTGLPGLAAMRPGPSHPILGLRRAETRALCIARQLEPVEDPSNADLRFRRNRVRHELVPLLDRIAERDVVPLLTRLADHARSSSDALVELAAALDVHDARALCEAPDALAHAAVSSWLRQCSATGSPPDSATVARVLDVARGTAGATDVGGGWRIRRSHQRLELVPPPTVHDVGSG